MYACTKLVVLHVWLHEIGGSVLQMSSEIVKFAFDLNVLVTRRYYGLMVIYAKLFLLLNKYMCRL